MLDLPRALEPWRSVLELFNVELATSLGDLVARLSVLVGPLERDDVSARGEPDGVSGIGRRGPFDRLLATDWALLHEVPDEFMRRAAEQQLSFFEIARREPSADRRSIAIFDAGVSQLGGPRVVHLAALVLLAQRASAANAAFSWGILQDPATTLYRGLDVANASALLRGRSRSVTTEEDAARWATFLGVAHAKGERELWLVGGHSTPPLVGKQLAHARITADDSLDPEHPNAVELAITLPRRNRRTARVEIPPPATSVRLLRDPFEVKKVRVGPGAPRNASDQRLGAGATPVVFGGNGKRLFTRGDRGALLTLSRSATDGAPRAYLPPEGDVVVAVGQKGKKTIVLLRSRLGHLTVEGISKRGRGAHWMALVKGDLELDLPDAPETMPLYPLFPLRTNDAFLFQRDRKRLLRIHHSSIKDDPIESHLVVPAVAAFSDGTSVMVVTHEQVPRLLRCTLDDQGMAHTAEIATLSRAIYPFIGATHLVFNELDGDDPNAFLIRRHAETEGQWTIIHPSADDEVIGLHVTSDVASLVVVNEARTAVVRIDASGLRTTLFEVPDGIVHAQLPQRDYPNDLVVLTKKSELQVRQVVTDGPLVVRYVFEKAP